MEKSEFSSNCISLRTAMFRDDGFLLSLFFIPKVSGDAPKYVTLGRKKASFFKLLEMKRKYGTDIKHIKEMVSWKVISFEWSLDGESVALCFDDNPWAFLVSTSQYGYSKAIVRPIDGGNPWDEELFNRIFK